MATHNKRMLGRTSAGASCYCCNDPWEMKRVARRRENRLWKKEAEGERWEPPAHEVFDGEPATIARW